MLSLQIIPCRTRQAYSDNKRSVEFDRFNQDSTKQLYALKAFDVKYLDLLLIYD